MSVALLFVLPAVTKKPLRACSAAEREQQIAELFEYGQEAPGWLCGASRSSLFGRSGELGRLPEIGAGSAEADLETVGVRFVRRGSSCGVPRRTSVWNLAVDFIPKALERRATKCLI